MVFLTAEGKKTILYLYSYIYIWLEMSDSELPTVNTKLVYY